MVLKSAPCTLTACLVLTVACPPWVHRSAGAAWAQERPVAPEAAPSADYIRIVDERDGGRVALETSSRVFKPSSGIGPTVILVGVMHIGDRSYYRALQEYLDAQGLVLYEGVKPSGNGEAAQSAPDDAAKARLTQKRLRLLATLVEKQKVEHGRHPESLEAMTGTLRRPAARVAQGAMIDGWGHPVVYVLRGDPGDGIPAFDLVSPGSDGIPGGEGGAADLKFSDQAPISKAEVGDKHEGIQTQLASALGLEFQLVAIDYDRPNWRNSDMSIDQVQARLKESGTSGEALFKMLDGSSFSARLAGLILGFIRSDPGSQAMAKLMMMEVLGHADELMERAPGAGKLMKVIVKDRNETVFLDLNRVLQEEKVTGAIALFYGAGHLPDMERRLTGDLGYTFVEDRWFRAIDMDLGSVGIPPERARQIREMMGRTFRAQLDASRKPRGGGAPESNP